MTSSTSNSTPANSARPKLSIVTAIRILNILAAIGMVVGAIGHFTWTSFQGIIVGCYLLIFGIGVILLEFRPPLQPAIKKYAGFMQRYMGRGILFIFLGVLGLDNRLILEIWSLPSPYYHLGLMYHFQFGRNCGSDWSDFRHHRVLPN